MRVVRRQPLEALLALRALPSVCCAYFINSHGRIYGFLKGAYYYRLIIAAVLKESLISCLPSTVSGLGPYKAASTHAILPMGPVTLSRRGSPSIICGVMGAPKAPITRLKCVKSSA